MVVWIFFTFYSCKVIKSSGIAAERRFRYYSEIERRKNVSQSAKWEMSDKCASGFDKLS
jgi:hypothetical protein